jgi:hypothetical protein
MRCRVFNRVCWLNVPGLEERRLSGVADKVHAASYCLHFCILFLHSRAELCAFTLCSLARSIKVAAFSLSVCEHAFVS